MSLSAPFIRRPIGTILLAVGLAMAGIAAFFQLPVAPLPRVDVPAIAVQANMPGASPSTMAATVAAPLERRLGLIAGIDEISSRSSLGSTQVVMTFDLSRSVDGAARDVQAAIAAARADLPSSLRTNPTYRKINPADAPILILTLTSPIRSQDQIYDTVSNVIQQKLLQVQGVGNVELGGASQPAVRVEINPVQLASAGIGLEDVRAALQSASANRPRGVLESIHSNHHGMAWQLYSNQAGLKASDFAPLVIAWRNGAPVRLADVAKVVDGPEEARTMGIFNGKRSVQALITRQPDANVVATVDAVKAQLPTLQKLLPADIKLQVVTDRTITIRSSLHDVEIALLAATLLVVVVVSLFLQNWRATAIPAVAVIVSLLGTLGVMYLAGFLLDNLSLMALTVATGFVVDDAIVVVENIARHVEDGMRPIEAALRGAREVGYTVLTISLSLIAVFVPLIFMGGLFGRMLREFALTMAAAVGISLIAALTITPMLASRLLRPPGEAQEQGIFAMSRRLFENLQRRYARVLDWALAHRGPVGVLLGGAMVLNVFLIAIAPKGFLPTQDTGSIAGGMRVDQSMSFGATADKISRLVAIIRQDPAVLNVVAFTGGSRAGSGFMFVNLKPRSERDPVEEVVNRLRPKLARVRGVSLFLNPVQDLQAGGRSSSSSYQYVLRADNPALLKDAGARLVKALKAQPGAIADVDIDQQDAGASAFVEVDRNRAASLGVPMTTLDNTLYDAFGQRQVATIYQGLNQYHVVMEADPAFSGKPEALANLYLPSGARLANLPNPASPNAALGANAGSGSAVSNQAVAQVPLGAVASWSLASTNAQVNHSNGEPSATVSFNLPPGIALGQAAKTIADTQATLRLPASVHGDFGGTAKVFKQSTGSIPLLIVAAILSIYIVLGVLYESAIHPLTVLSTMPSSGVGAILALIVSGGQFDLIALIGVILLIGIVQKNAILIIDFAIEAERSRGLNATEAIREASLLRFRPILMTTLAAGLGALPLALGYGDGAELRRPLGIAIVGGLIASQMLTLVTTPVVYLAMDRWATIWHGLTGRHKATVVGLIVLALVAPVPAFMLLPKPVMALLLTLAVLIGAVIGIRRLLAGWNAYAAQTRPLPIHLRPEDFA